MNAKQEIKALWQRVCDAGQFEGKVVFHRNGIVSLCEFQACGQWYYTCQNTQAYILGYLQGRIDGEGI